MRRVAAEQVVLALACCTAVLAGLLLARVPRVLGVAVVSFEDLEESLTCQCGCGLTVHACNHLHCPSAEPLREEIRAQMALGKSKAEILRYFRNKYGEKILSSPTTSGFNLVAWVLPFALMILGGLIVGVTIMRWSGRAQQDTPAQQQPARPPSPYDKILEKELKDFEG
jgi:cytochrome c-type biogenesis protein CcmH/NrfF